MSWLLTAGFSLNKQKISENAVKKILSVRLM